MRTPNFAIVGLSWIGLFATAIDARGDEPELADLISNEAGLTVEVREFKSLLRDIPKANWFRQLTELSFVKKWRAGPEFGKLRTAKVAIEGLVAGPLNDLAAELFGETVLLAVFPTPNGKPVAMLLSRTEQPESIERLLKAWDQAEPHEVRTLPSPVGALQRRHKLGDGDKTGPDVFTARIGRTIAITESESLAREVLERSDSGEAKAESRLSMSAAYRVGHESLPRECSIRAVVNPRAWDETIRRDHAAEPWLPVLWSRLNSISFGADLRNGVVLHAVVRHDANDLPDVWQRFVSSSGSDRQIAARLPAKALLAGELRLDPQLFAWLRTVDLSKQNQHDWRTFANVSHGLLGRDLFDEVLPHVRPNVGFAIVPREQLSPDSVPVDGLLTIDLDSATAKPDADSDQPSLVDSLDGALLTLWNFVGISHNSGNPDRPALLRRREVDETHRLLWLTGLSPYQLAYGVSADNLLIASDPSLATSFWSTLPQSSLATEPFFTQVRAKHFADSQQWLFWNLRASRQFLSERRPALQQQLMHWKKLDAMKSEQQLGRLAELLSPFDAGFAMGQVSEGAVRISAGLVSH